MSASNRLRYACKGLLLLVFLLAAGKTAWAQTPAKKEALQQRKAQLQDEIDLANSILKKTRSDKQLTLTQVRALEQKVRARESLIRTIDNEVRSLDGAIGQQKQAISQLDEEIGILKTKYAGMLRAAQRRRSFAQQWAFVFSAESVSQAIKRLYFLRQYARFRAKQVLEIQDLQGKKQAQISQLAQQKDQKRVLLGQEVQQKQVLVQEKSVREKAVAQLSKQEGKIAGDIKKKRGELQKLERQIQGLIADEMRKSREKAEREALVKEAANVGLVAGTDYTDKTPIVQLRKLIAERRKTTNNPAPAGAASLATTSTTSFSLTPEAQLVSKNFETNRGRLPWPVERGIVLQGFGENPVAGTAGVTIKNPGIDIATGSGSEARAVFEGEVSTVIPIPGANRAVLVKHGQYFTVYSNLATVYVKAGQKISTKQALGKVADDAETGEAVLHFELWKDTYNQDPTYWILRK